MTTSPVIDLATLPISESGNSILEAPPYFSEIAVKKVNSAALGCFEAIIHWFLTVFSCFYPAYDRFYNDLLIEQAANGEVPTLLPTITSVPVIGEGDMTPQKQLKKLLEPMIAELIGTAEDPGVLPIFDVSSIVAEYAQNTWLTNWHTALSRLNMLPDTIPPLPSNIHQILGSNCPIRGHELKEDNTPYQVSDTHSLYLIPPGALNELRARALAYIEEHLAEYEGEQNPLQANDERFFVIFMDHGQIQFNEAQWILIPNDPFTRSGRTESQWIAELNANSSLDYELSSLKAVIAFVLLHTIATGEGIFKNVEEVRGDHSRHFFISYGLVGSMPLCKL